MPTDDHELQELHHVPAMEEEETEAGVPPTTHRNNDDADLLVGDDYLSREDDFKDDIQDTALDRRVRRKLDCILLPFLAILFLLNSLDKSNIGNAETAGFTHDAGLSPSDLNLSLAFFFAFFVALQPVGAALGRRFGMKRWVPACMSLWGLCTMLHIYVRRRWQLVVLRIAIASLEAGFYPTTVSYLSLFYTRYEFGVRLGVFYGQTAVAGVMGGILSWGVFSKFDNGQPEDESGGWKSWKVLFMIEGCLTVAIALTGFFWLPRSADTAWFFNERERSWAEQRIRLDQDKANIMHPVMRHARQLSRSASQVDTVDEAIDESHSADMDEEAHHRLLPGSQLAVRTKSNVSTLSVTRDAGLTRQDILSAILNYKIWHLLVCNILSAIPATAFGVFLPLVVKQLSPSLNLSAAASNLLSAPPFAFGAIVLFAFTWWSDRSKNRLVPIFWGLGLLLIGLTVTVTVPMERYVLRYISLCVLLSGSFIASPLTVAWLGNNTPEPGKRAILFGINGWGNLAGVFSAVIFAPKDQVNGYVNGFAITLICVVLSFCGFIAFWVLLVRENAWREELCLLWSPEEREREDTFGDMELPSTLFTRLGNAIGLVQLVHRLDMDEGRRGDEKMTFRYGL